MQALQGLCVIRYHGMDRTELGKMGEILADELEIRSNNYHEKSDKHEILAWEAVGVCGVAEQLLDFKKCTFDLESSNLLGAWGESLACEEPELCKKVKFFREQYAQFKNT